MILIIDTANNIVKVAKSSNCETTCFINDVLKESTIEHYKTQTDMINEIKRLFREERKNG